MLFCLWQKFLSSISYAVVLQWMVIVNVFVYYFASLLDDYCYHLYSLALIVQIFA